MHNSRIVLKDGTVIEKNNVNTVFYDDRFGIEYLIVSYHGGETKEYLVDDIESFILNPAPTTEMPVLITDIYSIPGRGTVVIVEGKDVSNIKRGDILKIEDYELPIKLKEYEHGNTTVAGLVLGNITLDRLLPHKAIIKSIS